MKTDLLAIIVIVLTRGTSFMTKNKRSKEKAISDFNTLKAAYDLVPSNNLTRSEPKSLTLSRICLAFPLITSKVMSSNLIEYKGKKPDGLAKGLCWPGAPSIIPKESKGVYNLWLKWAISFDSVINPDVKGKQTRLKNLRSISKVAWKSDFVENDLRVRFMTSIGQNPVQVALEDEEFVDDREYSAFERYYGDRKTDEY